MSGMRRTLREADGGEQQRGSPRGDSLRNSRDNDRVGSQWVVRSVELETAQRLNRETAARHYIRNIESGSLLESSYVRGPLISERSALYQSDEPRKCKSGSQNISPSQLCHDWLVPRNSPAG